jgi:hypothetical protein
MKKKSEFLRFDFTSIQYVASYIQMCVQVTVCRRQPAARFGILSTIKIFNNCKFEKLILEYGNIRLLNAGRLVPGSCVNKAGIPPYKSAHGHIARSGRASCKVAYLQIG